jgi:Fe-S-cluster containining protein
MTTVEERTSAVADATRDARALTPEENAGLCSGCVKCCTYITVEIDAPRAAWEYDQWLWALHHEQINLYLERPERWFLHFDTRCRQLQSDGRCAIYGRHPVLCREYDPRSCERRLPLADVVAWFHTAEQFEAWIRERRPRHWERLEVYRRAPADPRVEAHAAATFVPVQALMAASAAPAHGAPRRPSRRRR